MCEMGVVGMLLLILSNVVVLACADVGTHKYGFNERVELFVNKVGPYANPQETYGYYRWVGRWDEGGFTKKLVRCW